MVLNLVWLGFFVVSFLIALVQLAQGQVDVFARLLSALFDAARTGFDISLGLTGIMALWLGILRIGEKAGLIALLARMVNPMFRHLFPGVPSGHAAQGAMTMNLSANLLGLDNAATPLGLKAMQELQHLNPRPDTATNAQILFIVLNTAGLTLIPTSVIAIRQTLALKQGLVGFNAADIFLPTLVATSVSLLAALLMVAAVQRLPLWRLAVWLPIVLFGAGLGALTWWLAQWPAAQASRFVGALGAGIIFGLVVLFLVAGAVRRVPVYDTFVEGAREGFQVAV
ncbi:MAG: nucleoside recognition domain-containing protein, partial [Brachymonas sp.]